MRLNSCMPPPSISETFCHFAILKFVTGKIFEPVTYTWKKWRAISTHRTYPPRTLEYDREYTGDTLCISEERTIRKRNTEECSSPSWHFVEKTH